MEILSLLCWHFIINQLSPLNIFESLPINRVLVGRRYSRLEIRFLSMMLIIHHSQTPTTFYSLHFINLFPDSFLSISGPFWLHSFFLKYVNVLFLANPTGPSLNSSSQPVSKELSQTDLSSSLLTLLPCTTLIPTMHC